MRSHSTFTSMTMVSEASMGKMIVDVNNFEDMKMEFLLMDEELNQKNSEIEELRRRLAETEDKLSERDEAAARMVDQMEELHENLHELDSRFERSEEINAQLRSDKEELKADFEKEIQDFKINLAATENRYNSKVEELNAEISMKAKQKDFIIRDQSIEIEKLNDEKTETQRKLEEKEKKLQAAEDELKHQQKTSEERLEQIQASFRSSIENVIIPLSQYVEKNKGSKTPFKKTKGYRLLKTVESDLKNVVVRSQNNNDNSNSQ